MMATKKKLTIADVAHVGRETPGGEWLRRYWLAVWRSEDLKDIPQAIKVLGEKLVLFRDQTGRLGLVGEHCPHRGTSLEYGDIEEKGIRCPYHGWLFDVTGQCLEQPVEPCGSTFHQKVKHLAYPVRELGGLIFAYMGPQPDNPPPLPNYSPLVRTDGARYIYPPRFCDFNWFNFYENAADLLHAYVLHRPSREATRSFENRFWEYYASHGAPALNAVETEYGIRGILHWPSGEPEMEYFQQIDLVLPSVFAIGNEEIEEIGSERVLFTTPIDDDNAVVYRSDFHANGDTEFLKQRHARNVSPPDLPAREYDKRKYTPFKGQTFKEDYVCMVTQGKPGYRSERFASSDKGVLLLRKVVLEAMDNVMQGNIPKGIIPPEKAGDVFKIHGLRTRLRKVEISKFLNGQIA
jgi:phenylpropionate dioxygenase-like ring-hydroxylating dioxygenase large terminal subunit